MRKKLVCIGIISIFLLSGLSLTVAGIKARGVKNYSISVSEEAKPNLYCPSITVTTTWTELTLFVDVANEMYYVPIPPNETFDIAFYFNDDDEPYYTIEDWHFSADDYDPNGCVQFETIVVIQKYKEFDFPKGSFTIKVKLDSNNDIDETNEEDNTAVTESIKVKSNLLSKSFPMPSYLNKLSVIRKFKNLLEQISGKLSAMMFPFLRMFLQAVSNPEVLRNCLWISKISILGCDI